MFEASAIPDESRKRCTDLVATLCQIAGFLPGPDSCQRFNDWLGGRIGQNLKHLLSTLDVTQASGLAEDFELDCADRIYATHERKLRGIYFTPRPLADQMASFLADLDGTIVDIACGSGELLLAALRRGATSVYGVELTPEGALVAAARITLEFPEASAFIEWGDGLSAGQIRDVVGVLGNPPYLGEKGNRVFFQKLREAHPELSFIHAARMDLAYFFIARSAQIARGAGLVLLTTEYWLQADSAQKLRKFLSENSPATRIEILGAENFADAPGHHSMIYVSSPGEPVLFEGDTWRRKAIEVPKPHVLLQELCEDRQGFVSGADMVDGKPCFLHGQVEGDWAGVYRPVLRSKRCVANRVFLSAPEDQHVLWIDDELDEADVELAEQVLGHGRERLEKRREVLNANMPWYRLHWPRKRHEMVGPKLVVPRRAPAPRFCLDLSGCAVSSDCTYLVAPTHVENPIEYLIRLMLALNSEWVSTWLNACGKRKGAMFEFYSTPLRALPVEPLENFKGRASLGLERVCESKASFVDLR